MFGGIYILYIFFSFLNDFDLLVVPIGVFGPEGTTGWNVWGRFLGSVFPTVDRRIAANREGKKICQEIPEFSVFFFFFEFSKSCIRSFMHLILSFTQEKNQR